MGTVDRSEGAGREEWAPFWFVILWGGGGEMTKKKKISMRQNGLEEGVDRESVLILK